MKNTVFYLWLYKILTSFGPKPEMILINVELFNFQIAVVHPFSHSVPHTTHPLDEPRAIKKDRFGHFGQSGSFKISC